MSESSIVQAVRRFNRYYTKQIGVLQRGWLGSALTLPEARVLYELAHRDDLTASDVGKELGLDDGYVSRLVRTLGQRRLLRRSRSKTDRRRVHLSLTPDGRAAIARLDRQTGEEVAIMLSTVSAGDQQKLVGAMRDIERLLSAKRDGPVSYVLRPPRVGELSWIVHRQAALYWQEWGYNEEFEALAAGIVADFVRRARPSLERCWLAEGDGEILGSVFLVQESKTVAKLRLLYVEPSARGLGIGARLVDECVRFARHAGYRKITLWTQSELRAARRLYERAGFKLTARAAHDSMGRKGLIAETWELPLDRERPANQESRAAKARAIP